MTDDDKFRGIDGRLNAVDARLDRHERRIQSVETARAVADKSQEHLDAKFAELKGQLRDEIRSVKRPLNAAIAAILLALVGGIMTFIMQGGLSGAAG